MAMGDDKEIMPDNRKMVGVPYDQVLLSSQDESRAQHVLSYWTMLPGYLPHPDRNLEYESYCLTTPAETPRHQCQDFWTLPLV